MSWFKTLDPKQKNTESTKRRKTSFQKEILENADQINPYLTK